MKITIYTINDCQFSKQEKEYLNSHSLQFEEKNLETNREFLTEMLAVSNNFAGTPVTKIEKDDGQISVLRGFTREEFDKTLGLSAPATQPTPIPPPVVEPTPTPVVEPPPPVIEPPIAPTPPPPPVVPTEPITPPAQANPLDSILNDLQAKVSETPASQAPPNLPNLPNLQ